MMAGVSLQFADADAAVAGLGRDDLMSSSHHAAVDARPTARGVAKPREPSRIIPLTIEAIMPKQNRRRRRSPADAEIVAGLHAARAAIDAVLALIVVDEPTHAAATETVVAAVVDDVEPEWISPGEAAAIRDCSKRTIVALARKHAFGVCSGGRWQIDRRRFLEFQAGGGG